MPAGNDVLSELCVVTDFRCWIPDPDANNCSLTGVPSGKFRLKSLS